MICFATVVSAQSESLAIAPPSFSGTTSVTWVVVPLVVHSTNLNRPLRRDDLAMTVDGKSLDFESFQPSVENPSTLLLFQDLSGSMANGGKLEASRRAAHCLLDQSRDGDQMAVVTFAAGKTFIETPITPELEVIAELVESWEGYGSTALHDAVTWIPEIRLGNHQDIAAVLITDGVDNASVIAPDKARDMVRQAEVPVYVVALRGSQLAEADQPKKSVTTRVKPQSAPPGFAPYRKVLRQLAAGTGGRYFDAFFSSDVQAACEAVVNDLRNRYTLSFPLTDQGEEAFHALRITVPGRRFKVRHRAGYVGRNPTALTSLH